MRLESNLLGPWSKWFLKCTWFNKWTRQIGEAKIHSSVKENAKSDKGTVRALGIIGYDILNITFKHGVMAALNLLFSDVKLQTALS